MRQGRVRRNIITLLCFVLCFAGGFYFKLSPSVIENFSDAMSGALAFAAIATALLFSCFSLIPAFSNSKLIRGLHELGTDIKIMDRLLLATVIFFAVSLVSLIELFLSANSDGIFSILLTSLWFALLVSGTVEVSCIIRLMFEALDLLNNNK